MKIQMIGYYKSKYFNTETDVDYTTFNKPLSLDEYDVNIINLQNEQIWRNDKGTNNSINYISDFISLKTMLSNSNKAINIIALPQNYNFCWQYYCGEYEYVRQLKDMLYGLTKDILCHFFSVDIYQHILYENTKTACGESVFDAAFYFKNIGEILTLSDRSEKATTIRIGNVIYTALNLFTPKTRLEDFLTNVGLIEKNIEFPEWVHDYIFFDDLIQKEIIEENSKKIEDLQEEISKANSTINSNLYYKSLLSNTGPELVKVVFDILEKMLNCDLSNFDDIKKEDFLIKKEDTIFIGEIKGINTNVRSGNISQIDTRYNEYIDDNPDDKNKLKALLIINPWRKLPVNDRIGIHQDQIDIAVRNKSLIVTTETLLKLYEKFLLKQIESSDIEKILFTKIGLLTEKDFN